MPTGNGSMNSASGTSMIGDSISMRDCTSGRQSQNAKAANNTMCQSTTAVMNR